MSNFETLYFSKLECKEGGMEGSVEQKVINVIKIYELQRYWN